MTNIKVIFVMNHVQIVLRVYALLMELVQIKIVIVLIVYILDQIVIKPVMKLMNFVKHVIDMEYVFLVPMNHIMEIIAQKYVIHALLLLVILKEYVMIKAQIALMIVIMEIVVNLNVINIVNIA